VSRLRGPAGGLCPCAPACGRLVRARVVVSRALAPAPRRAPRARAAELCVPVLTQPGRCAANKQPSQDILDHQAKRKVELKLMEFRLAMEVCAPA
jgi:hypothetical protein